MLYSIYVVAQAFKCIPTDSVKSFAQLSTYQAEVPLALSYPARAKEMLKDIQVRRWWAVKPTGPVQLAGSDPPHCS